MKSFDVEVLSIHSRGEDPELDVMEMDNQSMSVRVLRGPMPSSEDPPEAALSLSPKSSRSGMKKEKRKKSKKSKRSKGTPTSPRSPKASEREPPATPRSPGSVSRASSTRSPRSPTPMSMDIPTDLSREPPEGTLSREPPESISPVVHNDFGVQEDSYYMANNGMEAPEELPAVLPFLDNNDVISQELSGMEPPQLSGMEPPEATSIQPPEIQTLATPVEFKKTKSVKSSRSVAGSRRSKSRRKVASMDVESADAGALQGVFSGHLVKWRFEAEEGGPFIRIPAFLGANGLIMTTTYALIFNPDTWTILSIVLSLVIYAVALLSIVLEGRFMCSNPLGIRAHLRSALTRRNRVFRFVWGRGALYILAGILSCVLVLPPSVITGSFMMLVGLTAVITGGYSSRMFYKLRDSLKDDDYLASMFKSYDYDKDGFITLPEFVNLLSALGMDLDDRVGIKAFHAADVNHEYKISEEAFITWWKTSFMKNGKAQKFDDIESDGGTDEEEAADDYQRMMS